MLIVTAGSGLYQEEGKPPLKLKPGDVVHIPPNVKHWHGASATEWFQHLATEVPGEDCSTEWCEPVTDEEYVTVTALMAGGILDSSLQYHLSNAKKHGVTKEEIAEILTHAAFYAG